MRLGLLHSECEREPGFREIEAEKDRIRVCDIYLTYKTPKIQNEM